MPTGKSWLQQSVQFFWLICAVAVLFIEPICLSAATIEENISAIQQIDQKAKNGEQATAALQNLQQNASAGDLLPLLNAFQEANPLAANYLRNAVETAASRLKKEGQTLPQEELHAFVVDINHNPTARKIAFDLLTGINESYREELITGMLNDPSPELRREAVALAISEAKDLHEAKSEEAKPAFEKALSGAVDSDQVQEIITPLEELGVTVNLQEHFGFLCRWHLIGPFDNSGLIGFDVAYPPEKQVDLEASYEGKEGAVSWQELATEEDYGILDISEDLGPYKGAVMYATTEFVSPEKQTVEFRMGTPNAWKLWINGKLMFSHEEYQRGMKLDQYRIPVELQAGKNQILLKLLQNEQEEDWAQRYQFQFRVSDLVGSAVHAEK
ncbi:hypothetical protein Pla110_27370 [Polystyrenella longa]|uniref:Uncharacterized protein n=1 Tax=Polystyrenella longa TaxID=2528007 RepID=A0A518CP46_9PLAN|nr:hypothetical protein [Polystyrenella longa]QDU81000.1 hypothetical protein Pla110_27370 [Polystyrenella longa]